MASDKVTFQAADGLKNAGRFCATIARIDIVNVLNRGLVPECTDDTATVTFVEIDGSCYAVTALHVINGLLKGAPGDEVLATPITGGRVIQGPFVPAPQGWGPSPDAAIVPIKREDLPPRKEFIQVLDRDAPDPVRFALAAGFPTGAKTEMNETLGVRLKLHSYIMVAAGVEGARGDTDQMQFYSENVDHIEGDVSGMSGGPVFWSEGEEFGLLGFVKEGIAGSSRIHFFCERAPYATMKKWAEHADREHPKMRAKLVAKLQEVNP